MSSITWLRLFGSVADWWRDRGYGRAEAGYTQNPFIWSNAAEVDLGADEMFALFQDWHIDPGLPGTSLLNGILALHKRGPVLIYVPPGAGKTFYRRWAAQLIKEHEGCLALEVHTLADRIGDVVDERALAQCVHHHVCQQFGQPTDTSGSTIASILEQTEVVLERHAAGKKVFVFLDDVDQLFDDRQGAEQHNEAALAALAEFCRAAARRAGKEPALRIFVPSQLQEPLRMAIGRHWLQKMPEPRRIRWNAELCLALIEKRLAVCWRGNPTSGLAGGSETGLNHLNRLLDDVTTLTIRDWLAAKPSLSPRCVIEVFDRLVDFAHTRVAAESRINLDLWEEFLRQAGDDLPCEPEVNFPLRQQAAQPPAPSPPAALSAGPDVAQRQRLLQRLKGHFNLEELRDLTFELGIDQDDFPRHMGGFARELVLYCERHDRLSDLEAAIAEHVNQSRSSRRR